jgi:hypothetical protein
VVHQALVRLNKEVSRRCYVVGTLRSRQALLRLVGVLEEQIKTSGRSVAATPATESMNQLFQPTNEKGSQGLLELESA